MTNSKENLLNSISESFDAIYDDNRVTFLLLKRKNMYFNAVESKYNRPCKLLIDKFTDSLTLGEHTLHVNDVSISTSFGVDHIYQAINPSEALNQDICALKTDYPNRYLIEQAKTLGGRWDKNSKAWVFSSLVEDKVEEIAFLFYGQKIDIEVIVQKTLSAECASIYFMGYEIAKATGRDSGTVSPEFVAFTSTSQPFSGGSSKNWLTIIPEGTVFRMRIHKNLFNHFIDQVDEAFSIKILRDV